MEKTVSFQKANLVGVATLILLVPFYVAYAYVWELPNIYDYLEHFKHYLYFFAATVLLVFLHELIHAIFFALFSKEAWNGVRIGIIWKHLTPYAHCSTPLNVMHYRIALLMPGILLGLFPLILALICGIFSVFVMGSFLLAAAGGDFLVFFLTLSVPKHKLIKDHPSKIGFEIID